MLPLVYARPDGENDELECILIRRLQPSLDVMHISRYKRPRRSHQHTPAPASPASRHLPAVESRRMTSHTCSARHHSTALTATCPTAAVTWHRVNRSALSADYGASTVAVTSAFGTTGRFTALLVGVLSPMEWFAIVHCSVIPLLVASAALSGACNAQTLSACCSTRTCTVADT